MSRRRPNTIEVWQGDTLDILYKLTDRQTGEAKDLTDATAEWTCGRNRGDTSELTIVGNIPIPASNGYVRVTSTDITLDPDTYYMWLKVTDGDGIVATIEDVLIVHAFND